ncbi:hypothetical protein BG011_010163, partial [Mortierella polycephala]
LQACNNATLKNPFKNPSAIPMMFKKTLFLIAAQQGLDCNSNGARVRFCTEPSCSNRQPIRGNEQYFTLSEADGSSSEFTCVRQSHGYGIGLSKKNCKADERDSLFFFVQFPQDQSLFQLNSAQYGVQMPDYPWITKNGHGALFLYLS